MELIYVISTPDNSKQNIYKIGRHKGSQNKLLTRYKTYLINPIIYFTQICQNYKKVEKEILNKLENHRIVDKNRGKTEWVQLELLEIIKIIINTINKKDIETNNSNCKTCHFDILSCECSIIKYNRCLDKSSES